MHFNNFYAAKGTFAPGEAIRFVVEIGMETAEKPLLHLEIFHLITRVAELAPAKLVEAGGGRFTVEWQPPDAAPRGYGVWARLFGSTGEVVDTAETAFDVLPHWTLFPRYGFLSDFMPDRDDVAATLEALVPFHINGLQFYDWQYRHDTLIPPKTVYIDPLERRLSLDTVKGFIEAAHERGMAAMPYLAIYAASIDFWRAHPEWGLYDNEGQPHTFEDFLGLMDPSPNSPWTKYLLAECRKVLAELPFDGLHVDQYGDPKTGFNAAGQPVDIPAAFVNFISELKERHSDSAVVFNAVGNWPIAELAAAPQDFVYIEIWPPEIYYNDIRRIVSQARAMSKGKAVAIALYLPASQPVNILLADAIIFSLGGSRIELGERTRLLADPYFPKHEAVSPDLYIKLRLYYDFVVRYAEFLGPPAAILDHIKVKTTPGVWAIVRKGPGWLVVSLINLSGLGEARWDEAQPAPAPLEAVTVELAHDQPLSACYHASPDAEDLGLEPLIWEESDGQIKTTLAELKSWAIIAFQLDTTE